MEISSKTQAVSRLARRFLCALSLALFAVSNFADAQNPLDKLGPDLVYTLPTLPASGQATTFTIVDNTGVGAEVEEKLLVRNGSLFQIRAKVKLGYAEVLGSYQIVSDLGALDAGIYTVEYIAEARFTDKPYTGETKSWTWRFVVVDASQAVGAVEYYHSGFNHYFLTADAYEIAALDSGQFSGWSRTGQVIRVIAPTGLVAGDSPVCRFYGRPEAGLDTHVYTANETECAILASQPAVWIFERPDAFEVASIDTTSGACPINMLRVFRLWNGLAAANHRYTTSTQIQAQMAASGWIPEGSGQPPAIWCALPQ